MAVFLRVNCADALLKMVHSASLKLQMYLTNSLEYFNSKTLPKKRLTPQALSNLIKRPVWDGSSPNFPLKRTGELWLQQLFDGNFQTILFLDFSQNVNYRTLLKLLEKFNNNQLKITVLVYLPKSIQSESVPATIFNFHQLPSCRLKTA